LQTPLCVSLFTSSRDERYFSEPLAFRPERWLRSSSDSTTSATSTTSAASSGCPRHALAGSVHSEHGRQHRYACVPFSVGVRGCVGKRVAELQMQLLLAQLVHRFQLSVENEQPAHFVLRMVGVMSDELRLRLRPRQD